MPRFLLLLCLGTAVSAAPVVLYDGTSGQTPGNSGWTTFAPGAAESMGAGYVDFSTLALSALRGGYTRSVALGGSFRMRVDIGIVAESHANDDRAGFAIIALDDAARGIELSFWEDEVWVQNTGFTHGEGVAFDTTSGINRYDLFLGGGSYRVEINGVEGLSGQMRNYGGFGAPYNIPNFLFLGDNTTSALGRIHLAFVEYESLSDSAAAPEPAALSFTSIGVVWLVIRRLRLRHGAAACAP